MIGRSLLVLLLFVSTAHAQVDVEAAKGEAGELVTRGNELFEAKKFDEALASFERAYETYPSPKIHYNLARTLAACKRPLEALDHYQRFLGDAGLTPDDARYTKAKEEMDRLEDQIGKLAFVTDVSGSTLTLDEEPAMPLPESTIRVLPGPHRVVIETPDRRRFVETVEVAAGETIRVHVLFPSVAPPDPPRAITAKTPPPREEESSVVEKWWFWTAIGVAVVAVGVGVGVGVTNGSGGEFVREGELDVSSTAEWERR